MSLKQLNVNLDDIVEAMEQSAEFEMAMAWYLDRESGKVLMIGGDVGFDINKPGNAPPARLSDWQKEAWADCKKVVDDTGGRYTRIQRRDSRDAFNVMADFVEEVPDPRMRERLSAALEGKGAFRRFKDALFADDDVREQWFIFESNAKRVWAEEWLESLGIQSTWMPPVAKQKASDWQPKVVGVHHVQISAARGQEKAVRGFYCDVMGFKELEKPHSMSGRGGLWLGAGDFRLYVLITPAGGRGAGEEGRRVAYQVTDLPKWRDRLEKAGVAVTPVVVGNRLSRVEFVDPFGNGVELIQPVV